MVAMTLMVTMIIAGSCRKSEAEPGVSTDPKTETEKNTFTVEKEAWSEASTKAGKSDVEWEVGDEVTIYTEDGKYHNFKVKESHGMNAIFDCEEDFWDSKSRYKLYYPSLATGWLMNDEYVLTYGFHPTNSNHKVGDWMASDWVTPSEGKHMSFVLKHLSSIVTLSMNHPQAGKLRQCYLCATPLEYNSKQDPFDESNLVFGYKIAFNYDGNDFVLESYSKSDGLPLMFDKEKSFENDEVMISDTPMYTDALADENCNLILVYKDGNVYAAPIKLYDMEAGKSYSITPASAFVKVDKEPDRSFFW